ncbi:unnamed protein product, partial [Iphiclides podalirius]
MTQAKLTSELDSSANNTKYNHHHLLPCERCAVRPQRPHHSGAYASQPFTCASLAALLFRTSNGTRVYLRRNFFREKHRHVMEKEHQPDSMATITMKPEYPPSEVYSASEPPPAYRQRVSSSVQIARIAALTIIAASFILGSFILASSWVAARASCHQLEQLDAMLDKELALEGRSYGNDGLIADEPLPVANAHALHADPPLHTSGGSMHPQPALASDSHIKEDPLNHAESKIDEDKLQKIDDDNTKSDSANSGSDEASESEGSDEEDELDAIRPMFKPIQFNIDNLVAASLPNNQKGRMNCVVERRHEEPIERPFPFNILGAFAPRSAQAERIAIICHGGDESRQMPLIPEPQSQVFAFPLSGPVRLPIRPQPQPQPQQQPQSQQQPEPRMPPFSQMAQRPVPFPLPDKPPLTNAHSHRIC